MIYRSDEGSFKTFMALALLMIVFGAVSIKFIDIYQQKNGLDATIQQLNLQIADQQNVIADLNQKISQLQQQVRDLQQKLQSSNQAVNNLGQLLANSEAKIQQLQGQLQELQHKLDMAVAVRDLAVDKMSRLEAANAALQKEWDSIQAKNQDLTARQSQADPLYSFLLNLSGSWFETPTAAGIIFAFGSISAAGLYQRSRSDRKRKQGVLTRGFGDKTGKDEEVMVRMTREQARKYARFRQKKQ